MCRAALRLKWLNVAGWTIPTGRKVSKDEPSRGVRYRRFRWRPNMRTVKRLVIVVAAAAATLLAWQAAAAAASMVEYALL